MLKNAYIAKTYMYLAMPHAYTYVAMCVFLYVATNIHNCMDASYFEIHAHTYVVVLVVTVALESAAGFLF